MRKKKFKKSDGIEKTRIAKNSRPSAEKKVLRVMTFILKSQRQELAMQRSEMNHR